MMSTKALISLLLILAPCSIFAQQRVDVFADPENLKILPENISSGELSATMRGFAMGLGVRCETCHVGEAGKPLSTFDFASDEKLMKQKARLMLKMVDEINGNLVPQLDEVEKTSRVAVRCMTCHRGQAQPKLIEDVLDEQLADNDIDAAVAEYQALRETYFGSHTYDFSEFVLPMYTQKLAASGQSDAAIVLAQLNAGYFPKSYYTAFVLGELYAAADQPDKAVENYQRALELNPRAAPALTPKIEALKK